MPPDDRELAQYLRGDSRRKRGPNRWLASVALAASVLLGVNVGWNLREAGPVPAPAAPAPSLDEARKIDRLIAYVGGLQGALFIRNGDEHQAAEAARHLQMKREKAGRRVQTAGDFIRLCASHTDLAKEAYLIRFADGRTRTAEDVLREELARLEGR